MTAEQWKQYRQETAGLIDEDEGEDWNMTPYERAEQYAQQRNRFYLIEGLDEGQPITPYIIESNTPPCFDEGGDRSRYYEEISKTEADEIMRVWES